ncbi:MAG: hypothetical protein ABSF28_07930 [Terracidiphilus sp.]|jgi:hypothetical protein
MTPNPPASFFIGSFPHHWRAEILPARPLILPTRHFVYPGQAEEVERGALEVLVRPCEDSSSSLQEFLATCALGFRDPAVPTGLWSCPNPEEICAVSGGYAYIISTTNPERFTMISFRPVLDVRGAPEQNLLLFVGHYSIIAWGAKGQAWQSEKLSSEGLTLEEVSGPILRGLGWDLMTDKEIPFALDLKTGRVVSPAPPSFSR